LAAGPEKVEILRIATRQVGLVEYCRESEVLRRGPVLNRLDAGQQRILLEGGRAAAYAAGQEILELGQGAKSPALVLTGSVSLQSGPLCEVALVGAGDIFGLESLYPSCPQLGARAREEVKLAWLDARSVARLLQGAPALGEYFAQLVKSWQEQARQSSDFFERR
jgi:CRP-like cAMP-binding protein